MLLPDTFVTLEVTGTWELGRTAWVLAGWTLLGFVLARVFFRWRRRGEG